MNAFRMSQRMLLLVLGVTSSASLGCVAGGPLTAFGTPELDGRELDPDPAVESRGPIRLVSFPSIDVLPQWPGREEAAEASASVAAPFAAGTDAVRRGVGQVQKGFIQLGDGTRRALATTKNYLSRPLVSVRATPGEPSLLSRIFASGSRETGPRTTREFFKQERLR